MNDDTSKTPPPVADRAKASTPEPPVGHYGPGYGDPTPVDPTAEPEQQRPSRPRPAANDDAGGERPSPGHKPR